MVNIKDLFDKHPIVIISKISCPYCISLKEIIEKCVYIEDYVVYEVDETENDATVQSQATEISGIRTVPQVFLNGKFLGDSTQIKALYKSGALFEILTRNNVRVIGK